jgi:hypothetical protein
MNKFFRKRPVIVQAEQFFDSGGYDAWPEDVRHRKADEYEMDTPSGLRTLKNGDWIITSREGCRYPCSEAIFKMYYEPVCEAEEQRLRAIQ